MNDIEASLGSSQLPRITKFILNRNKIAKKYIEKLKDLPISFQEIGKKNLSSYHLFVVLIKDTNKQFNRDKL